MGYETPIFVAPLTPDNLTALRAALRSAAAFTIRRAQILLASQAGKTVPCIAAELHCTRPTVRHALHAFSREGWNCLNEKSSGPRTVKPLLDEAFHKPLRALLHTSPRQFGKPTSVWTLDLVAEVIHAQGWTPRFVVKETIRQVVRRLAIGWKRAKHWITRPDPAYARKKSP